MAKKPKVPVKPKGGGGIVSRIANIQKGPIARPYGSMLKKPKGAK